MTDLAPASGARLLPASEIARLQGLAVRARAVVEGVFTGQHRSAHRGASRDFSDHKLYAPGDDPRYLDWKAYARLDRPLVRRFESDTERPCLLVLDTSASMAYGDVPWSKGEHARVLLAALAFILLGQHDRVGLGALGGSYRLVLPPRARGDQLAAILAALEATAWSGAAALPEGLHQLAETAPRRSLVIVVSDLLDPRPALPAALRAVTTAGRELVVLQVLAPEEEAFPFAGVVQLVSSEAPEARITAEGRTLRADYLAALAALRHGVSQAARDASFAFLHATTATAPAAILIDWLQRRQARDRRASASAQG